MKSVKSAFKSKIIEFIIKKSYRNIIEKNHSLIEKITLWIVRGWIISKPQGVESCPRDIRTVTISVWAIQDKFRFEAIKVQSEIHFGRDF